MPLPLHRKPTAVGRASRLLLSGGQLLALIAALILGPAATPAHAQPPPGLALAAWAGTYRTAHPTDNRLNAPDQRDRNMMFFWADISHRHQIDAGVYLAVGANQWENRVTPGDWPGLHGRGIFIADGPNPRTGAAIRTYPQGWVTAYGGRFGNYPTSGCANVPDAHGYVNSPYGANGIRAFPTPGHTFYEYDTHPQTYTHGVTTGLAGRGAERLVTEWNGAGTNLLHVWLTRDHYCTFDLVA